MWSTRKIEIIIVGGIIYIQNTNMYFENFFEANTQGEGVEQLYPIGLSLF